MTFTIGHTHFLFSSVGGECLNGIHTVDSLIWRGKMYVENGETQKKSPEGRKVFRLKLSKLYNV